MSTATKILALVLGTLFLVSFTRDATAQATAKCHAQAIERAAGELGERATLQQINARAGQIVMTEGCGGEKAEQPADTEEEASETIVYDRSCSGWDCFEDSGSSKAGQWTEAEFFEVGWRYDKQYSLFSFPGDTKKLQGSTHHLALAYGWGTHRGDGISAVTLRLGSYGAHGEQNGQAVDSRQGSVSPGFLIGQYLSRRLLLTQGFNLLLSENGPGAQFDLGASVVVVRFLGIGLSVETGINTGFYRTGIEHSDGSQVNMFGLGYSLGLIIEPWGDYRVTK